MLREYTDLVLAGKIRLPAKTFPVENFVDAMKHAETGGKTEKTVLVF